MVFGGKRIFAGRILWRASVVRVTSSLWWTLAARLGGYRKKNRPSGGQEKWVFNGGKVCPCSSSPQPRAISISLSGLFFSSTVQKYKYIPDKMKRRKTWFVNGSLKRYFRTSVVFSFFFFASMTLTMTVYITNPVLATKMSLPWKTPHRL